MKSLINQFPGSKFLVTTSQWFYGPDGQQYRAAWGSIELYTDTGTLGIKTNDRSTNWYAVIGSGEKRVIVAGCQIHYAVVCMQKPFIGTIKDQIRWVESKGENAVVDFPNNIYIAE